MRYFMSFKNITYKLIMNVIITNLAQVIKLVIKPGSVIYSFN